MKTFVTAAICAVAMADQVILGPSSPADQPAWLLNITQSRAQMLASSAFDPSVYNTYLPWTAASMWIAPQSHLYDRYLYDSDAGVWTVNKFLDDLETRYGGIDGVLLWASYPNMGVDERNQFQLLEDLPGGLPALASAVQAFHARGVRVGLPYNPWDTDTARLNMTDEEAVAQATGATGADFVNGDTMSFMDAAFFTDSVSNGHPIALQPEGGPTLQSLNWTKMGWGYWPDPFVPPVDQWKWLVLGAKGLNQGAGHFTNVCDRWSTNHTNDIQQAWFNGLGFVSWENIWGIWNQMNGRDSEATRRVGAMSRYFGPLFFQSQAWEPHTVLSGDAAGIGVFASRWPQPVGVAYSNNATFWTIVNRGSLNYTGPVVLVPCGSAGFSYYDVYLGTQLQPQTVPSGGCALSTFVEAEGFSGILAINPSDVTPALTAFLSSMATMTTRALATYSDAQVILQQEMTDNGRTTPQTAQPQGMLHIPAVADWTFNIAGTEIEPFSGPPAIGVDVQFPWETQPVRTHTPAALNISAFYMDETPVTNGQYAAFLTASGYTPVDGHNFLRDWNCAGGLGSGSGCTVPAGAAQQPVTWVDLRDVRAYCGYYGKRLPNDWEWQYATQGSSNQQYPWGNDWDASRVPPPSNGAVRRAPPSVGSYPTGASPFGLMDMMGLVWQWTNEFTDDHTRAGLVRGGAWYSAKSSEWYFPNQLTGSGQGGNVGVRANTHNKLLLMGPAYDRHGTVGFRCVMDAAQ